uniref:Uncharacterized protein n=1 Tax=Mastacembelus armatus TaxID=205130 RepID=A0A7N8XXU2_9TELE
MQRARLLAAAAAMNGGLANGANPALMAGGLNPPLAVGGGAGLIGQPQLAQVRPAQYLSSLSFYLLQFVPFSAFALPAPVPNVYPVPAVNPVSVAHSCVNTSIHIIFIYTLEYQTKRFDFHFSCLVPGSLHGCPSNGTNESSSAAYDGNNIIKHNIYVYSTFQNHCSKVLYIKHTLK